MFKVVLLAKVSGEDQRLQVVFPGDLDDGLDQVQDRDRLVGNHVESLSLNPVTCGRLGQQHISCHSVFCVEIRLDRTAVTTYHRCLVAQYRQNRACDYMAQVWVAAAVAVGVAHRHDGQIELVGIGAGQNISTSLRSPVDVDLIKRKSLGERIGLLRAIGMVAGRAGHADDAAGPPARLEYDPGPFDVDL